MVLRRVIPIASVLLLGSCHDVDSLPVAGANPCADGQIFVGSACRAVKSCAGLASTCGPNAAETCCATALVGGTMGGNYFLRGFDAGGDHQGADVVPGFQPAGGASVRISDFYLDKYEITVGRFKKFVAAYDDVYANQLHNGDGQNPNIPLATPGAQGGFTGAWQEDWRTRKYTRASDNVKETWVAPSSDALLKRITMECAVQNTSTGMASQGSWTAGDDDLPMTCISWYEAFMFCVWDGGRLPTEAEWNFAAAGGAQQRAFPWSDPNPADTSISPPQADTQEAGTAYIHVGKSASGRGRFGQYDLAGNAYEWIADSPARLQTYVDQRIDPLDLSGYASNLPDDPDRVLRGGSFLFGVQRARTSARTTLPGAQSRYRDTGGRCARDVLR